MFPFADLLSSVFFYLFTLFVCLFKILVVYCMEVVTVFVDELVNNLNFIYQISKAKRRNNKLLKVLDFENR